MRRSFDDPYWSTPEGLRAQAAGYAYDNHGPGDPGWCKPQYADWTQESLSADQLTNIFASVEEARAWIQGEVAMDRDDEMHRNWHLLLEEDIREEVVVFIFEDKAYVWDGWHRIAASIVKGVPVKAIVGRRKPVLAQAA